MHAGLTLVAVLLGLIAVASGQEVIDSVDIGSWGQDALTYNSRAGVIYGASWNGEKVFAIACSTNTLVADIHVKYPQDIAYDPIDNKVFISYSWHDEDSILVLDGYTHARLRAFAVPGVWTLLYDSVSNRIYANCYDEDEVAVIDCASESVLCRIPVPGEPVNLTINTRHRKLYCQNDANMTVSVIDMSTNQIITNIYTGSWYFCAAYSEVADKYYCGFDNGGSAVTAISGSGDSIIGRISLPAGYVVKQMVVVEREPLLMAAAYSGGTDSIFSINAMTDSLVSSARVKMPRALVLSPRTELVYCANGSTWDNVAAFCPVGTRLLALLDVNDEPMSLALAPTYGFLYVGHGGETPMVYVVRDVVGIAELGTNGVPTKAGTASVVHRRYCVPGPTMLADIAGRPVAHLAPGPNDLSHLPPGVYIAMTAGQSRPRKVVILK
jgi:YVTN family beta-propeller protein